MMKILIIAPSWVGDVVMSQTLFKLLKQRYGKSLQLEVLANQQLHDLLLRMPEVNRVINNPFKHGQFALLQRLKFAKQLKQEHYHRAFILPNSFKSALIPFFAGIKKRTGFVGEWRYGLINDIYRLNKQQLPRLIDRFCALIKSKPALAIPQLEVDSINQRRLMEQFGLDGDLPLVVICPAAEYGRAKRWPEEHFALLSSMLLKQGYQVVILGAAKDQVISKKIIQLIADASTWIKQLRLFDLCGLTQLSDTVDVLALAQHVVSNDSGLMHVACSVGRHVIAIYGSSSPFFTPPLSTNTDILQTKLSCQPCFKRTCRYGHYNCLKLITPEMLIAHCK